MSYKVAHVANTIVKQALRDGIEITPLKLQKLLYFFYVTYKSRTGRKLFDDSFEVWDYGPVVPIVYFSYKNRKDSTAPIKEYMCEENGDTLLLDLTEDSPERRAFFDMWGKCSALTGTELSKLTHTEGSAWYKAYQADRKELDEADISGDYRLMSDCRGA